MPFRVIPCAVRPGNALGAQVTLGGSGPAIVLGVVKDTRYTSLDAEESPQAYVPYGSGGSRDNMMLLVRSAGDPRELIVPIRESFAATDREIGIADIMTIRERLWNSRLKERSAIRYVYSVNIADDGRMILPCQR